MDISNTPTDSVTGQQDQSFLIASQTSGSESNSNLQSGDGVAPEIQSNLEAALKWFNFGFSVVPVVAGSTQLAVDSASWVHAACEDSIRTHWGRHPEHDVGFITGHGLVALCIKGKTAQQALFQIERASDAYPNVIWKSALGTHSVFKLGDGVCAVSSLHGVDGAANAIVVATGDTLVMLPPSAGTTLVMCQADHVGKLTLASQTMMDAVVQYNTNLGHPGGVSAMVASGENGETGESGGPPFGENSANASEQTGETGESGRGKDPVDSATAFATFTAFAGHPAQQNCLDASVTAPPAESGESGISRDVGSNLALDSFVALQADTLGAAPPTPSTAPTVLGWSNDGDDVLTQRAVENPVVTALKARNLYITPLGSGLHSVVCPLAHEHTEGVETHATYGEPDDRNPAGVFSCSHLHAQHLSTKEFLDNLGVDKMEARHKPSIRVSEGDLSRVIEASELVLAARQTHYQSGGVIVSVSTDPSTGDPLIAPTNSQALTKVLSASAHYEKFAGTKGWVPSDPPSRHVGILHSQQEYLHLPPLVGVARQPYFRDDGALVTKPGYDRVSKRFGVFDPRQYVVPQNPTREVAFAALAMISELITEFRFAHDYDRAAAISGMCTATVRPSLPHAPALHVKAAVIGSGKTYLCDVVSGFAGPAPSAKVSFPSTSDEATKAIMSLLMKNPAVVEFDDMTTDWIPHGIINRMLTSEYLTDRILGVSKTATVSTRTLFLSSGNNVGPVRDVLRRVVTINLDPGCATPATISYKGNPVEAVRKHRGIYVAAVLTIIQAWKAAGSPRANVSSIATYGGAWSDYCRHPLIWLGLPDPATTLLEQVTNDPDGDALGALLLAWYEAFGTFATTVRKAISTSTYGHKSLLEAISDYPLLERGVVNPGKFGWLLNRNANRIVGGLKFVPAQADGRKAWAIVVADPVALATSLSERGKHAAVAPVTKPQSPAIDPLDIY